MTPELLTRIPTVQNFLLKSAGNNSDEQDRCALPSRLEPRFPWVVLKNGNSAQSARDLDDAADADFEEVVPVSQTALPESTKQPDPAADEQSQEPGLTPQQPESWQRGGLFQQKAPWVQSKASK